MNAAKPILDLLQNKRIAFAGELSTKPLNVNWIKKLSGSGDHILSRKLYKNDYREYQIDFPVMVASNAPPQFENVDAALPRRLMLLNFPTSFVTRPRRIGEKQIDSKLGDMIEKGTVLHRQFM
ncbi:hypothetical protein RF11_05314 [Thelohanellus kitauei]|uniref:Uncharacterized protein n=1 Tax=Thelohanellus kitauei TaxID=669202 RepID=A0A0C2MES1_THEKT|nr:hypothetical protein RF11_05314 [Thelohanellus kitauei]